MSYYYKYNFVTPEGVFAIVKEELKSYFDTGSVDDVLFPTYVNKCLEKLGKSSYNIVEQPLFICDFEARLPDNFYAVREAWLCADIEGFPFRSPNSFYSQAASQDTIQVTPIISGGETCEQQGDCPDENCEDNCMPELIQAVYKTNNEFNITYKKSFLLKPGNISVRKQCSLDCANFGSSSVDSFDIRDNKFVTNFKNGVVHLVFYATDYDNIGNQLIPDNIEIKEYLEAYIKYKVFETLTNQTNDETFNQLEQKMRYYKSMSDEAYIIADTEIKKQDIYTKVRRLKQQMDKFKMYELPVGVNRYRWRRNGSD